MLLLNSWAWAWFDFSASNLILTSMFYCWYNSGSLRLSISNCCLSVLLFINCGTTATLIFRWIVSGLCAHQVLCNSHIHYISITFSSVTIYLTQVLSGETQAPLYICLWGKDVERNTRLWLYAKLISNRPLEGIYVVNDGYPLMYVAPFSSFPCSSIAAYVFLYNHVCFIVSSSQ